MSERYREGATPVCRRKARWKLDAESCPASVWDRDTVCPSTSASMPRSTFAAAMKSRRENPRCFFSNRDRWKRLKCAVAASSSNESASPRRADSSSRSRSSPQGSVVRGMGHIMRGFGCGCEGDFGQGHDQSAGAARVADQLRKTRAGAPLHGDECDGYPVMWSTVWRRHEQGPEFDGMAFSTAFRRLTRTSTSPGPVPRRSGRARISPMSSTHSRGWPASASGTPGPGQRGEVRRSSTTWARPTYPGVRRRSTGCRCPRSSGKPRATRSARSRSCTEMVT